MDQTVGDRPVRVLDRVRAAASIREGLEETLTLLTLGIVGALYRTLGLVP